LNTTLNSMRLYFWPIFVLNTVTMTIAISGDITCGALFSFIICFLASFGYLINDLWDRQVDRVNHSGHFENSGRKTICTGIAAAIACLLSGFAIAFRLGGVELRIASLLAIGLTLYTVILRRYLLVPTLLASTLAASPLWAPLVFWPRKVGYVHWIFVAAMVLMLASRETLMDVRDRKGDRAGKRYTVATLFGPFAAKRFAAGCMIGGAILLMVALRAQFHTLIGASRIIAASLAIVVLALVVIPARDAVLIQSTRSFERAAIQKFVLSSRNAMALLPLLNLFLWGTRVAPGITL
jgi:4-hydroxybenzoate polyprenyltransferase